VRRVLARLVPVSSRRHVDPCVRFSRTRLPTPFTAGIRLGHPGVLLHFAFPDRYPIIDWRAVESLGEHEQASYPMRYWLSYVDTCRRLAKEAGVTMRVLDKALWQYSRERSR
jgi:hypothetical protein